MAEQLKMGLRPKRRPKYKPSDEEDPDNASYSRPNYVKMIASSHVQEYTSPAIVLNQNAKLLVKFINKANKDFKECQHLKEVSEKQDVKKDMMSTQKMKVQNVQSTKKQPSSSKSQKTEPSKKNKQLYNFKGLHQNSDILKNMNPEQMLKNMKGMDNILSNKGIYSVPLSNQLSQLQSLYPNLKDIGYQSLTQPPNPNLFQFTPPNQGQKYSNLNQFPVNQPVRPPKSGKSQESEKQDKLFKRSSYHVAIAYHIYLKKLQQKGIRSGNELDPTYRARIIKQKAGMGGQPY